MKKLQHLFAALILTLLLSISTFAGDGIIVAWRTDPPPPPPPAVASEAEGIIHTVKAESADLLTEAVLNMLTGTLALF